MSTEPMDFGRMSIGGIVGLTLVLLTIVVVAALVVGFFRGNRVLVGITGVALVAQGFHASEHLVQATYWVVHPFALAYMTPWAHAASVGVGAWSSELGGRGMSMARGMEALHLAMNLIFFCGAVAMLVLARRVRDRRALRSCRQLTVAQGLHMLEHCLLTVTLYGGGVARGVSTLFGAIPPTSAGAVGYRVLFHFTINSVGLLLAVRAARDLLRVGETAWTPCPLDAADAGAALATIRRTGYELR